MNSTFNDDRDDGEYLGQPTRRALFKAGVGSIAALAAGGLFGARVAQARGLDSPADVPVVDKLSVRAVTDSPAPFSRQRWRLCCCLRIRGTPDFLI